MFVSKCWSRECPVIFLNVHWCSSSSMFLLNVCIWKIENSGQENVWWCSPNVQWCSSMFPNVPSMFGAWGLNVCRPRECPVMFPECPRMFLNVQRKSPLSRDPACRLPTLRSNHCRFHTALTTAHFHTAHWKLHIPHCTYITLPCKLHSVV